ncbi:hypothetical protein [Chitinophaga vietnamensis]|uniref:hypothetical protein n=1 Tax=Chitinophaga vietnamensis TaxID=2593957 RepID=UPI00117794D5|nr:hypothetical protein [Chitinophaga vietnamensis]
MKNYLLACMLLAFVACKKGDIGPQGPQGNANITMYTFDSQTFTGMLNLVLNNITSNKMDSSLILVYYNPVPEDGTSWYAIPGAGPGNLYQTRFFTYQVNVNPSNYLLSIRTFNSDGSTYGSKLLFRRIRVIIAPATAILSGGRMSSHQPVDYNDYHAVMRYYHLPE